MFSNWEATNPELLQYQKHLKKVGKSFLRLKFYPIKTAKFQFSALKVVPHESPVELWNHFFDFPKPECDEYQVFTTFALTKNFPSKNSSDTNLFATPAH